MCRTQVTRSGALSLIAVIAACSTQPEDRRSQAQPGSSEPAVCLQGADFVATGSIAVAGTSSPDGHVISGMRWQAHEGCERFVIELGTADGAAAEVIGDVRAELLRPLGVVRVHLPGIDVVMAGASDTSLAGRLARAAYIVRSLEDRSLFVDLHLAGEAEARVLKLSSPARVVVDLRPGGGPVPAPALLSDRVVLLAPRADADGYPLRLAGYARLFEANVVARIQQEGREVARTFTTASDWTETWGAFRMSFESGPAGAIELHVGDYSPRDGEWEGVAVALTMRGTQPSSHVTAGR